jgi:ketosteroid isomerase-like protein
MVTEADARKLAEDWIEAWNAHDLDRIMTHYADEIEFTSPFVVRLMGDSAGTVRGRSSLRGYFATGLAAYPDLHFDLHGVAVGVDSVVLHYRSINRLEAFEVMTLNQAGLVARVTAHYSK